MTSKTIFERCQLIDTYNELINEIVKKSDKSHPRKLELMIYFDSYHSRLNFNGRIKRDLRNDRLDVEYERMWQEYISILKEQKQLDDERHRLNDLLKNEIHEYDYEYEKLYNKEIRNETE